MKTLKVCSEDGTQGTRHRRSEPRCRGLDSFESPGLNGPDWNLGFVEAEPKI